MSAPFKRLGIILLLSMGIALGISWLAEMDTDIAKPGGEPMVVFRSGETRTLTEETIVDELIALQLHADIRSVNVSNRLLEIDLEVDPFSPQAKSIKADISSLSRLGLAEADNIARVFVRVLEKEDPMNKTAKSTLLLAVTAGKSDFSQEELTDLREGERKAEEWLGSKLRLTTTQRWRSVNGDL